MNPVQQVARRYYDAWTSGDRDATVTMVAEAFAAFAADGAGPEGTGGDHG